MIIVTGGTSGLGKAVTQELRAQGNKVFTLSRSRQDLDNDHITCDVTDHASLKRVYKHISNFGESVEAIINCAGIASMNLAITTPPEVTERVIKTNLLGTIFVNQMLAPLLIKKNWGRIINFSTIAVSIGLKGESVYVASKAGVEAFSRVFANEMAPFNITVNCIAPGPVRTNLIKGISEKQISNIVNHQIIKKEMHAIDIVKTVNLLLSQDASNITGQVLHVGGV